MDVLAALRTAIADGKASFWQDGALASQARVEIPIDGTAMRLVFDVTAFAGGGLSVDAMFNNDRAMENVGGRVNYTATVTMNGREVLRETVSQGLYQNWHEDFSSNNRDGSQGLGSANAGWLNIRQDMAYLEKTAAIPGYDLTVGVSDATLQGYASWVAGDSRWDDPLYNAGIAMTMGATGQRPDIGITTAWNAAWIQSQDARAAQVAIAQADVAGSVPWNHWDAKNGTWLNLENYPKIWAEWRGGTGTPGDPNSTGLTRLASGDTGWSPTQSHQPNLSLIPYLTTGERWMLDNLNAQAAWNTTVHWPAIRDKLGKWLVATYSVAQVLVLRSVAALVILAPLIWREGAAHLLRPKQKRLQIARIAAGTIEVACFYWAVSMMPLADTLAFWMATPIFVAIASAVILGERLDRGRFAAVLLGFGGVLLALGASLDGGWLPSLVAILGVTVYSAYLMLTRALRGTSAVVLATYQMGAALVFGLVLAPLGWTPLNWFDAGLLMLLGIVGVVAHLAVTKSLALAPAPIVVPWQYAMILWGILFGWIFFHEVPTPVMLAGVAVIIGAGFWLTRMELRAARG
ncbi:DMT family transporter [Leptolyngbya sp. 15MV]|nr:DMT family transporter [Leptolyngbya sp. 15MV]